MATCICKDDSKTYRQTCTGCNSSWDVPMHELNRRQICQVHGITEESHLTSGEPVYCNSCAKKVCTCDDTTQTNSFTCLHCRYCWQVPQDEYDRMSNCKVHYLATSRCGGKTAQLCEKCDKEYKISFTGYHPFYQYSVVKK